MQAAVRRRFDEAAATGKTAALAKQVKNLGWKRALIIDGASVNETFAAGFSISDVEETSILTGEAVGFVEGELD